MKPYIFMAMNGIYIIDLNKTQVMIERACRAITKIVGGGEDVLFVGTKKQARDVIEREAKRAECPYVTYRWLGGMLTNFSTIRRSIKTLENYERMSVDGTYEKLVKKEQLSIEKEKSKLTRILGGIRNMRRLPGAIFVVDTMCESIAVLEARKLNIPIFAIVDTNVNPDLIDFPIPANDDAFKSIGLIAHAISDAIIEGKRIMADTVEPAAAAEKEEYAQSEGKPRPRRSRRRRSGRGNKPSNNVSSSNEGENSNSTNEEKSDE